MPCPRAGLMILPLGVMCNSDLVLEGKLRLRIQSFTLTVVVQKAIA